jgi:hypothetical protein
MALFFDLLGFTSRLTKKSKGTVPGKNYFMNVPAIYIFFTIYQTIKSNIFNFISITFILTNFDQLITSNFI